MPKDKKIHLKKGKQLSEPHSDKKQMLPLLDRKFKITMINNMLRSVMIRVHNRQE